MEKEKLLTSTQAAKMLQTNRATLGIWAKNGTFVPKYTDPSGYKYYTEEQVQHFIVEREARAQILSQTAAIVPVKAAKKNEVVQEKPTKPKKTVGRPRKNVTPAKPADKKSADKKPIFKMYVDGKTKKAWSNYYAMRSGKTNALCFIGTKRIFGKVPDEFVFDGEELQAEDNRFQVMEEMHKVNVILDSSEIDNISAAIAKGVLWIQLSFTARLGHNHPTDEEIEKARFMSWNVSEFMKACNLKDRENAVLMMRKMLSVLRRANMVWEEEIIDRDENGNPIVIGKYKDKDGKKRDKLKKSKHKYEGSFISTRSLDPVNGEFEYWINKEFATYLAYAGVIAVSEEIFKLKTQNTNNALNLAVKLNEYYSLNKDKNSGKQANIISVKNLLKAMKGIASYEDLTASITVTKDNGQQKQYEKHGDKGGWRVRIQKPFETAFETLVDGGILVEWYYRDKVEPDNYKDFENQYVYFKPDIKFNDPIEKIEEYIS